MPRFQSSDGLNLSYSDQGSGVPILCLAGLTRNARDFRYLDDHLKDVRLIKLDYRGRGESDWADDYRTYTVPVESRDALELMDHLGIDKFAVIGTSRGGLCAMTIRAFAPDRLIGVALNDVGPELNLYALERIADYLGINPIWPTWDVAAEELPKYMVGFDNIPAERWRDHVEDMYDQTDNGLVIRYDPKLKDAVVEAMAIPPIDLWPFFQAFDGLEVALIRGANSDLISEQSFQKMQDALPDALATTVKDRAHVPFLDEPEALEILTQWVVRLR